MRLNLSTWALAVLVVGIALEMGSFLVFEFFTDVPMFRCLGCSFGVQEPVISLVWFCLLSVLALAAIGGAFSRPLAGVGIVSTGASALALWILVSWYFPEGYLTSPWWPFVPIDGAGAVMAIGALARVIAGGALFFPRAAPSPQQ